MVGVSSFLGIPLPDELLYPSLLFLGIPAALLLLWLTRRSFVQDNPRYDDVASVKRRSRLRWTVFALRFIVVLLLIVALATPLAHRNIVKAGDTHITVLVDKSRSMDAMDTAFVDPLVQELRKKVPVTVTTITEGESSNLGEAILSALKPNENVLLVTDGYATDGPRLEDVTSFASQLNSTVNGIALRPKAFDAGVTVSVPEKAIADTNTTFIVDVSATSHDDEDAVTLQVLVDDVEIFNQATTERELTFIKQFAAGKHRITAKLLSGDSQPVNDNYDALLTVVPKPKLLLITGKSSGIASILSQLYTVTSTTTLPTGPRALDPYYAIVFIDAPIGSVGPAASGSALSQYLLDGNGLFVIGGTGSYDVGGYKDSAFESLLPVSVGNAGDSKGGSNIVLVMDMSGSTTAPKIRSSTAVSEPYPICVSQGANKAERCFRDLASIPPSCIGGSITQDQYIEKAGDQARDSNTADGVVRKLRTITCVNGSSSINATAIEKGDTFELSINSYARGSVSQVCLAQYCVSNLAGGLVDSGTGKGPLVRSLTLSVLQDLDEDNSVGVIAIGAQGKTGADNIRAEGQLYQWDYVGGPMIGKVSVLRPKSDELEDAVGKVQGGGQAASEYWLAAPLKALESVGGAKNVIVITDGQSCTQNCQAAQGGSDQAATINIARTIAAQGGRVYTVGVRPGVNDEFLTQLADAGNGIYFPATEKNKLKILFGDVDEASPTEAYGLVVLNTNHFITRDVPLQATMYGFNQVVPKAYSSLLVTTGDGKPALTVWSYGVGRAASLTVYNGNDYGELLAKGNSLILSRTASWAVGDPERKETTIISVPQMHVGVPGIISVTSDKIPVNDVLKFQPRGNGVYEATFTPENTGFSSIGGVPYAASYPLEYERVGLNPDLGPTLEQSNGLLFQPDATSDILEHVQTVRALQEQAKQPLRYPFLILAALVFLLEIALRRFYEIMRNRRLA